jgi:7-keto-8-aminopelargonate synthetase-like enzyme
LARFFRAERAVLLSSGYVTSLVVGQALAGEFTHVLLDQRAHVCLRDAARFFESPVVEFEHRSPEDLQRRIRACGQKARPILLTDGLFAHDGSTAPLRAYLELLPKNGWLLVDDAHGAGVLGEGGRGTLEWEGLSRRRIIQTITLSKAFGVYGGAILGPASLQKKICARSNLLTGNTPLPLPLVEAALAALALYRENPVWRRQLRENNRRLKQSLRGLGLSCLETPGPILYWPPRHARHGRALARTLRAAGIYPSWIRYPGGPRSGYFRFALSSAHRPDQVDRLAKVLLQDGLRR